jgi:hypothetical protein
MAWNCKKVSNYEEERIGKEVSYTLRGQCEESEVGQSVIFQVSLDLGAAGNGKVIGGHFTLH